MSPLLAAGKQTIQQNTQTISADSWAKVVRLMLENLLADHRLLARCEPITRLWSLC